ncbi:MAG: hypothetical protein A2068_00960 [Ignavibacteria bacterium GWB2_35_6b]|nr:MAG: hypothetical protein A2068_00960 [Ignavibacteria bacterium GWB2_35_6b]
MLKNFIKISLRNFKKNFFYSLINITGLAVGILCFIFIALWVKSELSYDKYNTTSDRIFRLYSNVRIENEEFTQAVTSPPFADNLKKDLPEIENAVRLAPLVGTIKYGDKIFKEKKILFVDNSFFQIFTVRSLKGNIEHSLDDPNSIVLTSNAASKYFGNENPIGKTITFNENFDFKVTGVVESLPNDSHFKFDILCSFQKLTDILYPEMMERWFDNSYYTYVMLKDKNDYKLTEAKLPAFAEKYMGEKMTKYGMFYNFKLQPLTDIHLYSDLRYEIEPTSSIQNVIIFSVVGVLILLLACINYINMATAVSVKRSKEVGVKKVLGAFKIDLIKQFLTESFVITLASLILALALFEILLPEFQNISGKIFESVYSFENILTLLFILITVSIFAGLYPAFVISSFNPNSVLKGNFAKGNKGALLRKSLVVFQNSVSIALLVSIIIITSQMDYITNRDLGYNKEHLVVIDYSGSMSVIQNLKNIKNELKEFSSINNVASSSGIPVTGVGNTIASTIDNEGKEIEPSIYRLFTDTDYINTYGLKLLSGRDFIDGSKYDSVSAFIINEAAVKSFGWKSPEDAIGKPFSIGYRKGEVIGVVNDFNFESLQKNISPVVFQQLPITNSVLTLQVQSAGIKETFDYITKVWENNFPDVPLDIYFMDEAINKQYQAESRFEKIFYSFAVIAVIIAVLGLIGMASFTVQQKFKEIGIRKVLGASTNHIFVMLTKDFLILVLFSNLFALPAAYYFMNKWLSDFAYKIEIGIQPFFIALFTAVILTLFAVGYQAVKASVMNPVKTIKQE